VIDRFELLYNGKFQDLAQQVARDMGSIFPSAIRSIPSTRITGSTLRPARTWCRSACSC
jgi:hypothetical protein